MTFVHLYPILLFLLVILSVRLSWLFKNYYHVEIFNQKTLLTVWFSWHFNKNLEINEKLLNLDYVRQNITNIYILFFFNIKTPFYTEKFYQKTVETSLVDPILCDFNF